MYSSIRLALAYLCLSCESITNEKFKCPVCGDTHLWPLENWLGNAKNEDRIAATGKVKILNLRGGNV